MNEAADPEGATPFERMTEPLRAFAKLETSRGILLIVCTVAALVWANSPWSESYHRIWHVPFSIGLGDLRISKELHHWINDGLMAIFFLLVGLEVKREVLTGELASMRKAALPIAAALGGMVIPASIYTLLNLGGAGAAGWGIPMATDIAFALGVLALLGNRVPSSIRIFLAALAVADDIGSVLVIAFFYTETISWAALGVAALFFVALLVMNRLGARHSLIYALLGLGLWFAFLKSGVHATVAGVLLALTIPARQRIDGRVFVERNEKALQEIREAESAGESGAALAAKSHALEEIELACERMGPPMVRFEHSLSPWVQYIIMPVFVLANAGVEIGSGFVGAWPHPINLGVLLGLVVGKPVGVVGFSWVATRTGLATLPAGATWRHVIGAGILAGIGFTMSLFIGNLAFGNSDLLEITKGAILVASLIAGFGGTWFLSRIKPE